jgi:hypothetical protein
MIRSNSPASNASHPEAMVPAVVTAWPSPLSSLAISRKVAGSSSTTRMRSDEGGCGSA